MDKFKYTNLLPRKIVLSNNFNTGCSAEPSSIYQFIHDVNRDELFLSITKYFLLQTQVHPADGRGRGADHGAVHSICIFCK